MEVLGQQTDSRKDEIHNTEGEMKGAGILAIQLEDFQD